MPICVRLMAEYKTADLVFDALRALIASGRFLRAKTAKAIVKLG